MSNFNEVKLLDRYFTLTTVSLKATFKICFLTSIQSSLQIKIKAD